MDAVEKPRGSATEAAFSPFDAGVRALLDAKQLSRAEAGVTSALLLCRAALRHLIRATLLDGQRIEVSASEAELWQQARLLALPGQGAAKMAWLAGAEEWFERFVVSPSGDLALAELAEREQAAVLAELLGLGFELAAPLDRARNGAMRRARRRRSWTVFAAALLLLVLGLVLRAALAPPNLALGRPVAVADADPNVVLDPKALVDGDQLTMAFHTRHRRDPYVTIDLGRVFSISRVEIHNRVDCCHDRVVPLQVQTSRDGIAFKTIAREAHTFTHATVRLPKNTSARYLRLLRSGMDVFHLAEVEVY